MGKNPIPQSVAAIGLVALALAGAAGVAGAAQSGRRVTLPSAADGRAEAVAQVPSATRAESLRLARKLLAKVVLPHGTYRFHGRKVPTSLRQPAEVPSSDHLVDAHRLLAERDSMARTVAFLDHHRPAGWSFGSSGVVTYSRHQTEKIVTYTPRHIGRAFSEIQMLVGVIPGQHGHALVRVDVQVIWYPSRSAAEHLVARHFRAVRIDERISGPQVRYVTRTFRQRAIIDKLTRVLNGRPASPGGTWFCPEYRQVYQLTFEPVKDQAGATVEADGCPPEYSVSVGHHEQPALAANGKIEEIADNLLRGSHKPTR